MTSVSTTPSSKPQAAASVATTAIVPASLAHANNAAEWQEGGLRLGWRILLTLLLLLLVALFSVLLQSSRPAIAATPPNL